MTEETGQYHVGIEGYVLSGVLSIAAFVYTGASLMNKVVQSSPTPEDTGAVFIGAAMGGLIGIITGIAVPNLAYLRGRYFEREHSKEVVQENIPGREQV